MGNEGPTHSFPDWVNTLVNASLTGCVVLVLVTVMGMKEKLIVVEQTMLSVQAMADKEYAQGGPEFVVRLLEEDGMARIEIKDNGSGMAEEEGDMAAPALPSPP